jgi:hypothetical protein
VSGTPATRATRGAGDRALEKETEVIEDSKGGLALMWRVDALQSGADKVRGGPLEGESMWIVTAIKLLAKAVANVDDEVARQLADDFAAISGPHHSDGPLSELTGAATAAEQAELLCKLLGDRAAAVGALLASQ